MTVMMIMIIQSVIVLEMLSLANNAERRRRDAAPLTPSNGCGGNDDDV